MRSSPRRSPSYLRSSLHVGVAAVLAAALGGCGGEDEKAGPAGPEFTHPVEAVEIVVDEMGISHVYGQSDEDAMFGAGYAMARDRLFHMEAFRRRALGRSAEVFGEGAINGDISARTFGFGRLGEADHERLERERPEDAALIDAWVQGVNFRIKEIETGAAPRPYGLRETELNFVPERWTAAHTLAIGKVLSFGMSSTLEQELLATLLVRLAPDSLTELPFMKPTKDVFTMGMAMPLSGHAPGSAPAPSPPVTPPLPRPEIPEGTRFDFSPLAGPMASNNWAVAGAHTENGKPLLAGDPHKTLTSPSRFWPVHISSATGTLDVVGFSFVGVPGVQLGHNAHIGWTTTTNFADVMDIWEVTEDTTCEKAEVMIGGEAKAVESRTETITYRTEAGGTERKDVVIRSVPGVGVFLPDVILPAPRALIAGGCLLVGWTGFAPTMEIGAYLGMDRAQNLDEFEKAVDVLEVGAANFIAAHPQGITYHVSARVPDRGDPSSKPMPWKVLPANDAKNVWSGGVLSPEKMPRWRDPERGYLVTANNDPFGFTADGTVENDPYYYGAFYANGFRASRIEQLIQEQIEGTGKMTVAAMQDIQRDVRWELADVMLPIVATALADMATDPALAAYQANEDLPKLGAMLAGWDSRLDRAEAGALVFHAMSWFAAKEVFADEDAYTALLFDAVQEYKPTVFLGTLYNLLADRFEAGSTFVSDPRVLVLDALAETATWLTGRFGSVDATYTWGDLHVATFPGAYGGELAVTPFGVDGGDDTVNVSPAPFFEGDAVREQFGAVQGSLYRMVVSFGEDNTPEAVVNFSRGSSEEPGSPHFDDQDAAWVAGEYGKLLFRKGDVDVGGKERVTLGAVK